MGLKMLYNFKFIPYFNLVVTNLLEIAKGIIPLLILFAACLLIFACILTKQDENSSFSDNIKVMYYVYYGNYSAVPTDDVLSWIVAIIIGISIPIILLNFLIALMSNIYNRQDQRKQAIKYLFYADLIWEIEVMYIFVSIIFNFFRKEKNIVGPFLKKSIREREMYQFLAVNPSKINNDISISEQISLLQEKFDENAEFVKEKLTVLESNVDSMNNLVKDSFNK